MDDKINNTNWNLFYTRNTTRSVVQCIPGGDIPKDRCDIHLGRA